MKTYALLIAAPAFLLACGPDCPRGTYPGPNGGCKVLDRDDDDDATSQPQTQPPPAGPGTSETTEPPAPPTSGSIVVVNDTTWYGVTQLDVQPCNNGELGYWDYLGGGYIDDGESFEVYGLEFGCYDVMAVDQNAFAVWAEYGIQLHADRPTFTLTLL